MGVLLVVALLVSIFSRADFSSLKTASDVGFGPGGARGVPEEDGGSFLRPMAAGERVRVGEVGAELERDLSVRVAR